MSQTSNNNKMLIQNCKQNAHKCDNHLKEIVWLFQDGDFRCFKIKFCEKYYNFKYPGF